MGRLPPAGLRFTRGCTERKGSGLHQLAAPRYRRHNKCTHVPEQLAPSPSNSMSCTAQHARPSYTGTRPAKEGGRTNCNPVHAPSAPTCRPLCYIYIYTPPSPRLSRARGCEIRIRHPLQLESVPPRHGGKVRSSAPQATTKPNACGRPHRTAGPESVQFHAMGVMAKSVKRCYTALAVVEDDTERQAHLVQPRRWVARTEGLATHVEGARWNHDASGIVLTKTTGATQTTAAATAMETGAAFAKRLRPAAA